MLMNQVVEKCLKNPWTVAMKMERKNKRNCQKRTSPKKRISVTNNYKDVAYWQLHCRKHSNVEDEAPTDKPTEELNPEENKERIDNLWASFKKDVDSTTAKKPEADSKPAAQEPVKETAKVVEEYEFAGEKVKWVKLCDARHSDIKIIFLFRVTREVPKPAASSSGLQSLKRPPPVKSGGLSGFFSSKKPKLTTLEKSKLDWDGFKKDEGIEEDLKTFNQGKQGFLERKAFLERTDMKQFEIERNLRMGRKNGPWDFAVPCITE